MIIYIYMIIYMIIYIYVFHIFQHFPSSTVFSSVLTKKRQATLKHSQCKACPQERSLWFSTMAGGVDLYIYILCLDNGYVRYDTIYIYMYMICILYMYKYIYIWICVCINIYIMYVWIYDRIYLGKL
jgi:hypothetical protein